MPQVLDRPKLQTLHDVSYLKVVQAVEQARAQMAPGQNHIDILCPLFGGQAFILPEGTNTGRTYVGGCQQGCFDLWE